MATPGMQSIETTAPPSPRLSAFLGNFKTLSDVGIALPVFLYSCGFVVLGCYSEANNLGLQAFPTIQFFSAGAGFLLIFIAVSLAVLVLRQALAKIFNWLNSESALSKTIKKALPAAILISIGVYWVSEKMHMQKLNVAAMIAIGLCLFFSADGWMQHMTRYYLYFNGFAFGVALLAWYAFSAYPSIPASFGGGKPRAAHILIDKKSISPDLSKQLMKPGASSAADVVDLSADVYLITDNSILVKVLRMEPADAPGSVGKDPKFSAMILQLRQSDVSAIFWESRH
ncbi:MAG TPA: hypothetical protein VNZ47_04290 [Candidatus Dormibacteraeota bacterium]|nr:hypothetical protein [Candidatus Dormibacteraeota bacterium]